MKTEKFAGVRIIQNGSILLVQEAHKEACGLWSFPLGHVENDEGEREAAVRETKEETGFTVALEEGGDLRVAGSEFKSTSDFNECLISVTIFDGSIQSGVLQKGDDILDARWFLLSEVEHLPLRGDWVKALIQSRKN